MKLRFSKKNKMILSTLLLLLVIVIAGTQFLFIQPLNTELQQMKQNLKTEQKLLSLIVEKKSDIKDNTIESTTELQQKLPVMPLLEQLILDLEKAEVVSDSSIKSMSFSKDGELFEQETNQGAIVEGAEVSEEEIENTTSDTKGITAALPEGVKKITIELNVESSSYEKLEKFIETLESLKRIVVVEMIDFTGGEELTSVEKENEPLTYRLTVSAFYMPELTDLKDHLPKLESPEPANKRNPLSDSSKVTKP